MPDKANTLIIGGGIIGLLTARELVKTGQSVTVLERNKGVGLESSWAGGGILSPLYPWRYPEAVNILSAYGHKKYPKLAADLFRATGVDPEYVRSGHLVLNTEEYDQAKKWSREFSRKVSYNQKAQFFSRINNKEIARIEPEVAENFLNAFWFPAMGQIRNPCLMKSLIKDLIQKGVKIITRANVEKINTAAGKVVSVETSVGKKSAENYLIAAGAWSALLLKDTGVSLDVEPVRGQMILFRAEPERLRTIIMNNGKYLIPRRDGHILAGSTLEYVGFNKEITDSAYSELWQAAVNMVPFLENAPVVNQWAGLRPGSTNGIPTIDRHPEFGNLVICTGHFRNGVIIGLGSARIAAELINDSNLNKLKITSGSPYSLL
ncbi:glycine oxidase [bacterium BMS3Bbin11]|nr:glycine oxidase [bacterium BMS3Bbin11]GMT40726.1 MAG: glycine oxidase ThiO [bacterium]